MGCVWLFWGERLITRCVSLHGVRPKLFPGRQRTKGKFMDLVKNELRIPFWSTVRQSLIITSEKMANTNFWANCATAILLVITVCPGTNAAVQGERQVPYQTSLAPIPTDAPDNWMHPGVFVQR